MKMLMSRAKVRARKPLKIKEKSEAKFMCAVENANAPSVCRIVGLFFVHYYANIAVNNP